METANLEKHINVRGRIVPLTTDVVDFKVGLFRSQSRLGRAGQAVGSYYLPGDTTSFRHPVRSAVYQGLTPGGSNSRLGRRIGGDRQFVRCPSGFEFGGRFAGRNLTNCGRRVFELPGEGPIDRAIPGDQLTGRVARAARLAERVNLPNARMGTVREIVSAKPNARAISISRNASIPSVGPKNVGKQSASISAAVNAVVENVDRGSLFVRRDGVTLAPTVSHSELGKLKNNADMAEGVLVTHLTNPSSMGTNEIPALLRTDMNGVVFAFPGGGRLNITKTKPLTPSEQRRLSGVFTRANSVNDQLNYDAALVALVDASNGTIKYDGRFPGVQRPYERISVENSEGQKRIVPRWVYEIFLSTGAPQRQGKTTWTEVKLPTEKSLDVSRQQFVPESYFSSRQAVVEFKTASFIRNNDMAAYAFHVKRVAAVWDDELPPHGGYRCPPGTRYGGRITDRFGRNCGWNVSRRLANDLERLGRNIGQRLDDRRDNRVAGRLRRGERQIARQERRVGRAGERLQQAEQRLARLRNVGPDAGAVEPAVSRRAARRAGRLERQQAREVRRAERRQLAGERARRFGQRVDFNWEPNNRRDRNIRAGRPRDRVGTAERQRRREERAARRAERRQRAGERARQFGQRVDYNWEPNNRRDRNIREDRGQTPAPNAREARRLERQQAREARQANRRQRRGEQAQRARDLADRVDYGWGRSRDEQVRQRRERRAVDRAERRQARAARRAERRQAREVQRAERRQRGGQRARELGRNVDSRWASNEERDRKLRARGEVVDQRRPSPEVVKPEAVAPEAAAPEAAPAPRPRRPRQPRQPRPVPVSEVAAPEAAVPKAPKVARRDWRENLDAETISSIEREISDYEMLLGKVNEVRNIPEQIQQVRNHRDNAVQSLRTAQVQGDVVEARRMQALIEFSDKRIADLENRLEAPNKPEVPKENVGNLRDKLTTRERALIQNRLEAHKNTIRNALVGRDEEGQMRDLRAFRERDERLLQDARSDGDPYNIAHRQALLDYTNQLIAERHKDDRQRLVDNLANEHDRRVRAGEPLEQIYNWHQDNAGAYERQMQRAENRPGLHQDDRAALIAWYRAGLDFHNQKMVEIDKQRGEIRDKERAAREVREAEAGIVDSFQGDVAEEFAKRVADKKEKRKKVLAQYMKARHGDDKPWMTHGVTVQKLKEWVRQGRNGQNRGDLENFAKLMFEHDEIKGLHGLKFKTKVNSVTSDAWDETVEVQGAIYAWDEAMDDWKPIGNFTRDLFLKDNKIYNRYMSIQGGGEVTVNGELVPVKNGGFTSVFNPYAWAVAKNAGFTRVGVTAGLEDGPYVWGKFGFRATEDFRVRQLHDAFERELSKFNRGQDSIIKNRMDANMVEMLLQRNRDVGFDKKKVATHLDFNLALQSKRNSPEEVTLRDTEIENWFRTHARFGAGEVSLRGSEFVDKDPTKILRGQRAPRQRRANAPEVNAPEVNAPEVNAPEVNAPEVNAPEVGNILPVFNGGATPRAVDNVRGRIGDVTEGEPLPTPRNIVNPNITTKQAAIDHVRNGGSLNELPNEFWFDALHGNASEQATDRNTKFRYIKPDTGQIGITGIFMIRNEDGSTGNQGWLVKYVKPGYVDGRPDIYGVPDAVGEIVGNNLLAAHGITVDGGGWDGIQMSHGGRKVPVAIIPHAFNHLPEGDARMVSHGGDNFAPWRYTDEQRANSYPARVANLLHNWTLRINDRHGGNGITMLVNDKPMVMPIDQGWAGRASYSDLPNYARREFSMDHDLFNEISLAIRNATPTRAVEIQQQIVDTYDGMLERARRVTAGGKDEFVRKMMSGIPFAVNTREYDQALERVEASYDVYAGQIDLMLRNRDSYLRVIMGRVPPRPARRVRRPNSIPSSENLI